MYAGCIPVFLADRYHPPFADVLDYSAFSMTIPENEIDKIDDILSRVSARHMDRMQAAGLKVRDAFLFQQDGQERARQDPVYWTLVSMSLRLPLCEYCCASVCEPC